MVEIGLKANREVAKHWLAVLEGADLQMDDIVVVLPFDSAIWQDAREDLLVPMEELHLNVPYTPLMEENTQLQDAITATRLLLNRLRVPVMVVVVAPHPGYLTAPCCSTHMTRWNNTSTPVTLMDGLVVVDQQMEDALTGEPNCTYLSLKALADACVGAKSTLIEAWQCITNSSNLFFCFLIFIVTAVTYIKGKKNENKGKTITITYGIYLLVGTTPNFFFIIEDLLPCSC